MSSIEDILKENGITLEYNSSFRNFTNWEIYYDEEEITSTGLRSDRVIVPVVFFLLAVAGTCLNASALTLMYRKRTKLTIIDLYLVSHFISSILYLSLFVPIIAVAYGITDWTFGGFACKVVNYGMTVCLSASMLSVTTACLHNTFGHQAETGDKCVIRNLRIAKLVIAVVWILSGVVMAPRMFLYNVLKVWHLVDERRFCSRHHGTSVYREVDTTVLFLALFFIPLLVQAVCHARIFKDLHHRRDGRQTFSSRLRFAKTLVGISATIFIGWLPTHLINFSEDFVKDLFVFRHREVLAYGFSYASIAVVAVIYICRQRADRKRDIDDLNREAGDILVPERSRRPSEDIECIGALISESLQSGTKFAAS